MNEICDESYILDANSVDYLPLYSGLPQNSMVCDNCSECNAKIQEADVNDIVLLNSDIVNQVGSCIDFGGKINIIFDCQNHLIDGDDIGTDYGLILNKVTSNVVRNCQVSDFYNGFYIYNYSKYNSIIESDMFSNVNAGLLVGYYSDYNIADNINATSNKYGVFVDGSRNNLTNSYFTLNTNAGIYIDSGSHYNVLENITSTKNVASGILTSNANYNQVLNANVSYEGATGISFEYSSSYNLINNSISNYNNGNGMYLGGDGNRNVINYSVAMYNKDNGLSISKAISYPSLDNVSNSVFVGNGYSGIAIDGSNHTIFDNMIYGNSRYDISVTGSNSLFYSNYLTSGVLVADMYGTNFWNNSLGGNYWSTYDSISEGCYDSDLNGFCDDSYAIYNYSLKVSAFDYMPKFVNDDPIAKVRSCSSCAECSNLIQNVSETGDTVYLISDIVDSVGTCIDFGNRNLIDFDCQGHLIDGDDVGTDSGINLSGYNQLNTIKNCHISDFFYGVYLKYSSYNDIYNLNTSSNKYGVYLDQYSHKNSLNNLIAEDNQYNGVKVYSSSYNVLNNILVNRGQTGVELNGDDNVLNNVVANNNTGSWLSAGVKIYYGNRNAVSNVIATGNQYGVVIYGGTSSVGNNVSNVSVSSSSSYGLYSSSSNSTVSNVEIDGTEGIYSVGVNSLFYDNFVNVSYVPVSIGGTGVNFWNNFEVGNYWGKYDETGFSQTCVDADVDGICDVSYTLGTNNIDYLPLADYSSNLVVVNVIFQEPVPLVSGGEDVVLTSHAVPLPFLGVLSQMVAGLMLFMYFIFFN